MVFFLKMDGSMKQNVSEEEIKNKSKRLKDAHDRSI